MPRRRRQRVHLFCLCWNDARMLPFFFRHYDKFVDKYFIYDNGSTDGSIAMLEKHGRVEISHFESGDSFVEEERRLGDTMWRDSDADWVIITDIDEHIYHPDLTGYLKRCRDQGVTAIRSIGYEMVSDAFPSGNQPLYELVTIGTRSTGHDRLCIFNPKEVTATNFGPGRHEAAPTGRVIWPEYPEILLLHFKQLGVDYPIARSAELRHGLRPRDLTQRWGFHYTWNAVEIAGNWQEIRAASGPVPGLGTLRHIQPAQYFDEERIVEQSGLFDSKWYLAAYPDVESAGADPLSHYCTHGWKEGRKPNFYFDPEWYCAQYPELHTSERNPLCDYAVLGERAGAWPSPLFNAEWYRTEHGLSAEESPLRHYLQQRTAGCVSPLPDFDVLEYCQRHPEILAAGADPFEDHCERDAEAAEEHTG
jgi:hypothetical protein